VDQRLLGQAPEELRQPHLGVQVHRGRQALLDAVEQAEIRRPAVLRAVAAEEDHPVPAAHERGDRQLAERGINPTMPTVGVGWMELPSVSL